MGQTQVCGRQPHSRFVWAESGTAFINHALLSDASLSLSNAWLGAQGSWGRVSRNYSIFPLPQDKCRHDVARHWVGRIAAAPHLAIQEQLLHGDGTFRFLEYLQLLFLGLQPAVQSLYFVFILSDTFQKLFQMLDLYGMDKNITKGTFLLSSLFLKNVWQFELECPPGWSPAGGAVSGDVGSLVLLAEVCYWSGLWNSTASLYFQLVLSASCLLLKIWSLRFLLTTPACLLSGTTSPNKLFLL